MISATTPRPRPQHSPISVSPSIKDSSIQLAVKVPSGAKLFVNEKETKSTGATRQFVSRNLERGRAYEFSVRAEVMDENGKLISETKQVSIQAGESEILHFKFMDLSKSLVKTMGGVGSAFPDNGNFEKG